MDAAALNANAITDADALRALVREKIECIAPGQRSLFEEIMPAGIAAPEEQLADAHSHESSVPMRRRRARRRQLPDVMNRAG